MPKRIVITGGPGSGKTTLINALGDRGYSFLPEVSREVTSTARQSGIEQLFLEDPLGFSKALLQARVRQYQMADNFQTDLLFYDRGIPDITAYLDYLGQPYDASFASYNRNHQYDQILLLPPWAEIYVQDKERYETFDQAQQIHDFLVRTYRMLGYETLEVPSGNLEQRVEFINKRVI